MQTQTQTQSELELAQKMREASSYPLGPVLEESENLAWAIAETAGEDGPALLEAIIRAFGSLAHAGRRELWALCDHYGLKPGISATLEQPGLSPREALIFSLGVAHGRLRTVYALEEMIPTVVEIARRVLEEGDALEDVVTAQAREVSLSLWGA